MPHPVAQLDDVEDDFSSFADPSESLADDPGGAGDVDGAIQESPAGNTNEVVEDDIAP